MKVSIEQKLCRGCGICEIICPEVFLMKDQADASQIASVRDSLAPSEALNFCKDAADCCPASAIQIQRDVREDSKRLGRMVAPGIGQSFTALPVG